MSRLRGAYSGALFHQLNRLFHQGTSIGSTEGELLERFVTGRDEAAFEALVARHGPMVLGVCRQLLRDPNDVDDAFQATFLVLVRKAGTLRRCDLLGNWLYGVAYRVAARARSLSARRMARAASAWEGLDSFAADRRPRDSDFSHTSPGEREQTPWLHHEVSHLPEKYRIPVLLCYFEGLTHDEAAAQLGWPLGTVKGRLARARDLLRRRLSRRGVTLSATAVVSHLTLTDAKAAVPAFLQLATLNAARALVHQTGMSLVTLPAVAISVTNLVEGVLQTMFLNQVKSIAFSLLFVGGTVATGVVVAATQLSGRPGDGGETRQVPSPDRKRGTDARATRKAAQHAAEEAQKSVSAELAQQLRAAGHSFENLLSKLRDPGLNDIDRLSRWSSWTLQADLELGSSEADLRAAYQSHRDRMKNLRELIQKLPVSASNQPVKAAHAEEVLQTAEEMLKNNERSGMMGGRRMMGMGGGMAGGMGGGMGGGMMGMGGGMAGMGSGMGGGMMGTMREPGSTGGNPGPARAGGQSGSSRSGPASSNRPVEKKVNRPDQPDEEPRTAGEGRLGGAAGGMAGMGGGAGGSMGVMGGMGMGGGFGGQAGMGMGGGFGGQAGMGMGGGFGGQMSAPDMKRRTRLLIAETAPELAIRDTNPKSKAIHKKLEEPISMSFNDATPLEDVVKYIKQATTSATYGGLPIYVDPTGLAESESTMTSTVSNMDLEGVPLKTSLRLILKQRGLAYCVRDGVLIISSEEGVKEELMAAEREIKTKDDMESEGASQRGQQ